MDTGKIEKRVSEAIASELFGTKGLTFIISIDQLTDIVSHILSIGLKYAKEGLGLWEHEDLQKTVNCIVELADGWSDTRCSECGHKHVKPKTGNPFCVNFECPHRYAVIVPKKMQEKK